MSAASREIGPIPPIADVERRERCRKDLRQFCITYNPTPFYRPFAPHHLDTIKRLEECIFQGALYGLARPRGDGKSLLCRMAALFAVANGWRRYPFIIGANKVMAEVNLSSIEKCLRLPLFAADYPEICWAFSKLQQIANRATGQTCNGVSTGIKLGKDRLIFPSVPPPPNWPQEWPLRKDGLVPTSGSILGCSGLTGGGIRGANVTLEETGDVLRPDLVLLDDPQTRRSARSATQCDQREQLILADVLGMAGPGEEISACMPCTVIEPGDLADRFLDQEKHPAWRGERQRMLISMPKNLDAWDEYFEVYKDCLRQRPPNFREANRAYKEKRAILDEGAEASWPERKKATEVSAIQHAMHLFHRSPRAFWSEYQNTPEAADLPTEARQLALADLAKKLNQSKRGEVPPGYNRLTSFLDIQAEVFYWIACAWNDRFGGAVIDYGCYPEQRRPLIEADNPSVKLSAVHPLKERAARIYTGLGVLIPWLLGRSYLVQGSGSSHFPDLRMSMCLIDSGFEPDAVHEYVRNSPLGTIVMASKGKGIGPDGKPFSGYRKDPGDKIGHNWRIAAKSEAKGRYVSIDTNAWKSFAAEGLLAAPGSSGSIYLPGKSLDEHPMLTAHLLAEYRKPTFGLGSGRWVDLWKARPGQRENHYWDGIVGCAAGASVSGLQWSAASSAGEAPAKSPEKNPPRMSDSYRAKHGDFGG